MTDRWDEPPPTTPEGEHPVDRGDAHLSDADTPIGRRGLVTGLALGGLAVGAGVVGAWAVQRSGGITLRRRSLALDMACLGTLWRTGSVTALDEANGDERAPFSVEGWLYPEGTIRGDGFVATEVGSIGRWFCRGWVIIDQRRTEPHIISHQEFILGEISERQVFPPDSIATSGLEGTGGKEQLAQRSIVGGTGEYLGASGLCTQQYIADNTTPFGVDPDPESVSPCFRFGFDIRVIE